MRVVMQSVPVPAGLAASRAHATARKVPWLEGALWPWQLLQRGRRRCPGAGAAVPPALLRFSSCTDLYRLMTARFEYE